MAKAGLAHTVIAVIASTVTGRLLLGILLLQALAATFVAASPKDIGISSLQTLLSQFKVANLTNLLQPITTVNKLDLNAIVSQWVAATSLNIPLPTLSLSDTKLATLQVTPCRLLSLIVSKQSVDPVT